MIQRLLFVHSSVGLCWFFGKKCTRKMRHSDNFFVCVCLRYPDSSLHWSCCQGIVGPWIIANSPRGTVDSQPVDWIHSNGHRQHRRMQPVIRTESTGSPRLEFYRKTCCAQMRRGSAVEWWSPTTRSTPVYPPPPPIGWYRLPLEIVMANNVERFKRKLEEM